MIRVGAKELREKQAEMLDRVQREPVMVERNGRPVAVIYSYEEAKTIEKARFELLKAKIAGADQAIDEGRIESFDTDFIERLKSDGRQRLAEKNTAK